MLKIAHRGFCDDVPENSLRSVQKAIEFNFDMIEIDIQLDRNNEIVLYHDIYLDNHYVSDLSFDEIKEKVPHAITLLSLLQEVDYRHIRLYIDMKGNENLAHKLIAFIERHNIDVTNIWFGSFNMQHLHILQEHAPYFKIGLITSNSLSLDILSLVVKQYRLSFVACKWYMLNKDSIALLKELGCLVFAYTLQKMPQHELIRKVPLHGIVSDIWF